MNYKKIYDNIIIKAQNRTEHIGYFEKHHITPRCMKGNNLIDNIVKVTAKEHYMLHYLLMLIYPENNKLKYAFWMMCNGSRKGRPKTSAFLYEQGREAFSRDRKGVSSAMKGKKHTEEAKRQNSLKNKGHKRWVGKTHSQKSKDQMSKAALGRKLSNETKQKMSNRLKGIKYSETHKENIAKSKLGSKNPMARAILQYDLNGILIKEWATTKEAATTLKIRQMSILDACRNRREEYKNYIWTYK